MKDDEARKKILARRAAFVAAALATVAGADACSPQPCLEPPRAPPGDGGADTEQPLVESPDAQPPFQPPPPMPCLSPMPPPRPDEDGGLRPPPRPCLSIKAPDPLPDGGPPPRPCLKIAPKP